MEAMATIDTATLRDWLEKGNQVNVLDVRPMHERIEWFIPGSIHANVYDKLKAKDENAMQGLYLDKAIPVVTVCAGGKTSVVAAEYLQQQGYNAYSLVDGMKGWSLSWNTAKISMQHFEIIQVRRTGRGCLSYIVSSNAETVIVDASLSPEVYEQILKQNNLVLKFVFETHIHADHLSRSKQLAERNNVPLYLPVPNKVSFAFQPIDDATTFHVGNIIITAIQTPGHTLESVSFLIDEKVLLTGDTLFINGVGRPDLKANADDVLQKNKTIVSIIAKVIVT
ncbi:MAG: MBL fold metallo-hydrolase [Panacibacter sp.]